MTLMPFALRWPSLGLTAVLLLVPAFVTVGCGADDDPEQHGPTVTATGPETATTDPSADQSTSPDDAPDGTTAPTELPDSVAALCAPYSVMVTAVKDATSGSADPDEIAAEIGPVMKDFAAQVPDLERPPSMPPATWRGVQALAAEIVDLPDEPTLADIEAIEEQLTPADRAALQDAADWLRSTCV